MTIAPNIIINFFLDTLLINYHAAQLKKWFELKKTSVKTLLND